MLNLKNEYVLYGSSSTMLSIVSILSVILGIYVIISKNPVISILFLIGLFFSISVYLIIIGLHFLGLSYLLIYIGAVSIFFIFIVMLINIRISELLTDNSNSIALAFFTVLLFNFYFNDILSFNILIYDIKSLTILTTINELSFNLLPVQINHSDKDVYLNILNEINNNSNAIAVTSKSWDSILIDNTHIASIGSILYTNFYILLLIVSFILLLAMIGAIVITISRKQIE